MTTAAEIDIRFDYHVPGVDQQELMAELRKQFKSLARVAIFNAPESRELSLALTALEQAHFYVNAAIARRS